MSPTLIQLVEQTGIFLDQHWLDAERPAWSQPWLYQGEIPGNELPGCYALLHGQDVLYLGVGAGKGQERYEEAGLGSRLHVYWCRDPTCTAIAVGERRYLPTNNAKGVTAIATIALPRSYWYMAYALEPFLIARLRPERNRIGRRS